MSSALEYLYYADRPDSKYNCYNGNIGTMRWSNSNYEQIRGYKFVYDNANRLTDALYGERANLNNKENRYNEVLEYDENGNITNLQRRGLKQDGQYGKIDNLNLSYIGNQLSSVEEDAKDYDYAGSFEYKRVNGSKYMYNENGSLVADKSRKIAYIEYDLNNTPVRIQFTNANVTKYVYSATGEKLRVIYQTSVYPEDADIVKIGKTKELTPEEINCTETVDYLLGGSLVMKNGKIDKILFDGGYAQATAVNKTTKDKFAFYYYNQDHLGNNREVVDAKGAVTQVTNYYPFGAPYADATAVKRAAVQPYKYNGKELDLIHGLNTYDYGARQHDPILAHWDRIDPHCESYYNVSPYTYCNNNPVSFIDPDGKDLYLVGTHEEQLALLNQLQNLTNDKLGMERKTGRVFIMSVGTKNKDTDLSVGTSLISDIIENENRLRVGTDNENYFGEIPDCTENSKNGIGTSATILVDLNEIPGYEKVSQTGNTSKLQNKKIERNRPIWLGHELIHGYRDMTGVCCKNKKKKN